jgi:serine/threonine protein phosphatase PrpC
MPKDNHVLPETFVCPGTTPDKPRLQLQLGHATCAVAGKVNEDFHGIVTPREEPGAQERGVAVAVADGVSGNGAGRLASETAVKSLLRDYYAAPEGWNISQALDKLLRSVNDWLYSENARHPEYEGMVTTLTLIVFMGNHYHLAHVGDTRHSRAADYRSHLGEVGHAPRPQASRRPRQSLGG